MANQTPAKQQNLFPECRVEPKYSINWAEGIVKKFNTKYPRVTNLVDEAYHITEKDKVIWLAFDNGRWPKYRAYIKKRKIELEG